ncbi:MAG: uracil-DNA glycosylase [Candidatus Nanoarchaeia archaeon]
MKKLIFGEGPKRAKIVLIGEAGGAEEEKKKRPFVGRAGKFLDKELKKFGFDRKKLYITNVVKERCVGTPKAEKIRKYLPYLISELKAVKPKIIVLLGRTAAKAVPRNLAKIYLDLPHPAAAMRFPKQKKLFEKGLKLLKIMSKK